MGLVGGEFARGPSCTGLALQVGRLSSLSAYQTQKMMMLVKLVFGSRAGPLDCHPEPISARCQLSVTII